MLSPLPPSQWDYAKAAHLLNRAGFGGTPANIDSLAQAGMAASIHYLIDGPASPVPAPPPDWAHPENLLQERQEAMQKAQSEMPPNADAATQDKIKRDASKATRRAQVTDIADLMGWWLERMRESVDPLEEKMTLFWHGHFATSFVKVKNAYYMWRQNQTFREHARGNFNTLVKAMSRDPAMIVWLDLRESRAEHPNENFAREVMELFTLGEGHYTEKDVTEGARAFTGYRIDPRDESFLFQPRQHDNTPKTMLGRSDILDGDQAIDTITAQPACARFIARKLWTFFAYDNPPDALVEALAATLRAHRYELRPVLHQMFTSQEFYSSQAVREQIKSPVQWLVQTTRELEVTLPPRGPMIGALRQMGQVPFNPPNVKGWDGGKAWISTSTLLTRYNLAGALLGAAPKPAPGTELAGETGGPQLAPALPAITPGKVDVSKLAPANLRANPDALVRNLGNRFFQGALSPKDEEAFSNFLKSEGGTVSDSSVIGLVHLMMSTPRYQLC